MGTIAPTDEIAGNLPVAAAMLQCDARRFTRNIVDFYLAGFEEDLSAGLDPGADQIPHQLVLAVHGDGAAARELVHIDAMTAAIEAKFDAAMNQTFPPQAFADARFVQQIHRTLFENARAEALLDVVAGVGLDDYRVDAFKVEQVGEDEAGWSGSDDAGLRAEFRGSRHGHCALIAHLYDKRPEFVKRLTPGFGPGKARLPLAPAETARSSRRYRRGRRGRPCSWRRLRARSG